MTVADIVFAVGVLALIITAITSFFDIILAVIDLLFLKAVLIVAALIGLIVGVEALAPSVSWIAPGEGVEFSTGVLMLTVVGFTIRYKIEDAKETEQIMREMEAKATARRLRGESSLATITAIERTGLSINDNPQLELKLDMPLHDGREAEITVRHIVDLVDIPRFQPGCTVSMTYDREDPENFEIHWDERTAPAAPTRDPGVVSGTGAPFTGPLWTFGMEDADEWLFSARGDGPGLLIVDITDPHDADADEAREKIVDMAAFVLMEHLWLCSDAAAAAALMVNLEDHKVIHPVGPMSTFEELRPFLDTLELQPAVAWGAALPDLEREGIQLKLRHPESDSEPSLSGPLLDLREMTLDWLERHAQTSRAEAPAWFRPLDSTTLLPYSTVLHDLQLQILADEKNEVLAPLDADMHEGFTKRGLDLADEHASSCPQLGLLAVVVALYARRADKLPDELRRRAVNRILADEDRSSALFRLSPHLLRQLGASMQARARHEELFGGAGEVYAAWLAKIEILPLGGTAS